jgi:hypothetical protein
MIIGGDTQLMNGAHTVNIGGDVQLTDGAHTVNIGGDAQLTDGPHTVNVNKEVENNDTCVTDGKNVGEKSVGEHGMACSEFTSEHA